MNWHVRPLGAIGGGSPDPSFTFPLSAVSGATSAFSLRKVNSSYAGPAVRLQSPSGSTLDVGFTPNGNPDNVAPQAFGKFAKIIGTISGTTLTVTQVLSGAVAVNQAIFGSAMDDAATIVSGSGSTWTLNNAQLYSTDSHTYTLSDTTVAIWYDQSGNGHNAAQVTRANQPFYFPTGMTELSPGVYAQVPTIRSGINTTVTSNGMVAHPITSRMKVPDAAVYKTSNIDCYIVTCTGSVPNGGGAGYNAGLIVGYPTSATSIGNDCNWGVTIIGPQNINGIDMASLCAPTVIGDAYLRYLFQHRFNSVNLSLSVNGTQYANGGFPSTLSYANALGLHLFCSATLDKSNASSATDLFEVLIYGAQQTSGNASVLAANQTSYCSIANPPTNVSTSDGFNWTPNYQLNLGFTGVVMFDPVDSSSLYDLEHCGNYWSLWKCNNINNSTSMVRFRRQIADVPSWGPNFTASGERSELDGGNQIWTANQTVYISYALLVESPGFPDTTSWNTYGQYHYQTDVGSGQAAAFNFNLWANQFNLQVDHTGGFPQYTSPTITLDAWYDFVIKVKMSSPLGSDILQVWINGPSISSPIGSPLVNLSGSVFPNSLGNANAARGYWKVGAYAGSIPVLKPEACRYANLEVTLTDITSRVTTPLAHPTHA